jgi:hypothetical protein
LAPIANGGHSVASGVSFRNTAARERQPRFFAVVMLPCAQIPRVKLTA